MNERFAERMKDRRVAHDTRVVADFIRIYCDGNHAGRERRHVQTDATRLGVLAAKPPVLCEECEAHLAYAEKRRAYCPQEPKPFCAHCDTQCYRPDELEWQAQMMRYSGPKSWRHGHTIDGIRHVLEGRRYKKEKALRDKLAAAVTREESR